MYMDALEALLEDAALNLSSEEWEEHPHARKRGKVRRLACGEVVLTCVSSAMCCAARLPPTRRSYLQ